MPRIRNGTCPRESSDSSESSSFLLSADAPCQPRRRGTRWRPPWRSNPSKPTQRATPCPPRSKALNLICPMESARVDAGGADRGCAGRSASRFGTARSRHGSRETSRGLRRAVLRVRRGAAGRGRLDPYPRSWGRTWPRLRLRRRSLREALVLEHVHQRRLAGVVGVPGDEGEGRGGARAGRGSYLKHARARRPRNGRRSPVEAREIARLARRNPPRIAREDPPPIVTPRSFRAIAAGPRRWVDPAKGDGAEAPVAVPPLLASLLRFSLVFRRGEIGQRAGRS